MRFPGLGEAMDNVGQAIGVVLLLPLLAFVGLICVFVYLIHLPAYLLFRAIERVRQKPHF